MPWWGLFDARDEEVELVCSELLTLYRAHDENSNSKSSTSIETTAGEASPVNGNGGGGENRRAVDSSQTSFAEDLSKRRNNSHGP